MKVLGFPLKRWLWRLGLWGVISLAVGFLVLVWWCANEVCRPSKRAIREKAEAYLDGTRGAGFVVEEFVSSGGMPALICNPVAVDEFSEKAAILRERLEGRGVSLSSSGEVFGTILILHGRRGRKENYLAVAERFCAAGFRCVIPDLPGHGMNPEKYATYGVREGEMVLKCYLEAAEKFGFSEEACGVFGQSMGGSVAVHVAALPDSPFGAMVILASFGDLYRVMEHQTNEMLGPFFGKALRVSANQLVGQMSGVKITDVRPVDQAGQISIPTMFAHGGADKKVPDSNGRALYAAFPKETETHWVTVPGAAHYDVMITDFPLYAEMSEWFHKNLTPR